jgi:tetratricopeptide (TPR) repeat protein
MILRGDAMSIQPGSLLLRGIVVAGVGLAPVASTPESLFSPALLEALDPMRTARSLCGGRSAGVNPMRALMAAAAVAAPASAATRMPLNPDLAASPFPLSTGNQAARQWFSQGLMLSYGFNHAGAVASFRRAQQLDPACAMCWWGEAAALGPNINAPMDDRDRGAALAALEQAKALKANASPMEQALIEALATRYARDEKADRATLDGAYADAMLKVVQRFPGDDDAAVLAAEAVMDTSPWNYWEADRKTPVGRSGEAVRLLEGVLARNPGHAQAAHLYIHMMEASDPKRAEAAADRLAAANVPSAAHLVHMPAHAWLVLGRYQDSIRANIAAARSDEAFIAATGDRGLVRYGYYPHNIHFIVASAQMAGDMQTAIREAKRLRTVLDVETSSRIGWVQAIDAAPFLAMAQFARPDEILAMSAPDARLPYANAMRHYARAIARAAQRNWTGFDAEMTALAAVKANPAVKGLVDQAIPVPDLIALAENVARGRRAMAERRFREAAGHFRAAAAIEAKISYIEPPFWYYPVRQSLGAALHLSGDYEAAIQSFREALVQTPNNGWALYGLAKSHAAAGHRAESAAAQAAFKKAWVGNRRWLKMERL